MSALRLLAITEIAPPAAINQQKNNERAAPDLRRQHFACAPSGAVGSHQRVLALRLARYYSAVT
jgi:hypothetical protein